MQKNTTIKNASLYNLLQLIVEGIEEVKGENIVILDFCEIKNAVFDFFVICEGSSSTQTQAISQSISRHVRKISKRHISRIEGSDNAEWVLLDYTDIIVHVFQKHTREYYNIEELWGDTKRIDPKSLITTPQSQTP